MRTIGLLPVLALLTLAAAAPARAAPAIAFDVETGAVVHAHEAFRPWYPASLTKLMTVYLVFRANAEGRISADAPVTMTPQSAALTANVTGWKAGEEVALADAVRVLMVKSANDMGVAVAQHVSGTVEAFVAEMNATAARLGMTGTNFVNPHGLHDPAHVSTARDMGLLAQAIWREFPEQAGFFDLAGATVRGQAMTNFNRLLGKYPGADGMKTGFVCAAGYNQVASAARNGRRVVAVVLGALSEDRREQVAAALLDVAFAGAGGTPIQALAPQSEPDGPVDMRPHTCGKQRPPAALVSYGLAEPAPRVPLPVSRPAR